MELKELLEDALKKHSLPHIENEDIRILTCQTHTVHDIINAVYDHLKDKINKDEKVIVIASNPNASTIKFL